MSIYTYDASDNRIEFEAPQAALTYRYVVDDDDGNMLTRTDQTATKVISYGWDDFDKLLSVSSSVSGRKQDNRYHTESAS